MSTVLAESISLSADATGAHWNKVFPLGVKRFRADFPNGIEFSRDMLASMVERFSTDGAERPVNYHHRGASSVAAPIDDKVAAGWVQKLELREDGLYAEIRWTARARKYIQAEELRYLSPEFDMGGMDKRTGKRRGPQLTGIGLLNDPFLLSDLPQVAAMEQAMPEDVKPVETPAVELKDEAKKCPECGQAIAEKEKAEKAFAEASQSLTESATKLTEAEAKIVSLTEQVAKLESDKRDGEIKSFFDGLVTSGKCAPAMREGFEKLARANGLDAVKFLEGAPAVVAKGEVGVTGSPAAESKEDAQKRFYARRDEHMAKGLKFSEAQAQAAAELPDDFARVFNIHSK